MADANASMSDFTSAWAACKDDAARIELFNRWLKSRRPLPSEDAACGLPTQGVVGRTGRGSAYSEGRAATDTALPDAAAHAATEPARLAQDAEATRIETPALGLRRGV